jgi:hypothetical protein
VKTKKAKCPRKKPLRDAARLTNLELLSMALRFPTLMLGAIWHRPDRRHRWRFIGYHPTVREAVAAALDEQERQGGGWFAGSAWDDPNTPAEVP